MTALVASGAEIPVTADGNLKGERATRDQLVAAAQDSLDECMNAAGIKTVTRKPEMFVDYSWGYGDSDRSNRNDDSETDTDSEDEEETTSARR